MRPFCHRPIVSHSSRIIIALLLWNVNAIERYNPFLSPNDFLMTLRVHRETKRSRSQYIEHACLARVVGRGAAFARSRETKMPRLLSRPSDKYAHLRHTLCASARHITSVVVPSVCRNRPRMIPRHCLQTPTGTERVILPLARSFAR